jgi:hypothetical protein
LIENSLFEYVSPVPILHISAGLAGGTHATSVRSFSGIIEAKTKPTLLTADARNGPCCYASISYTLVKSYVHALSSFSGKRKSET